MGTLTADERETVSDIRVSFASVSLAACIFILCSMLCMRMLKTVPARLVFVLTVTLTGAAIADILTAAEPSDDSGLCKFQACLMQFCQISSIFWAVAIAVHMFLLVKMKVRRTDIHEKVFHAIIWPLSLLSAALPFTTGNYGLAGTWCWITEDKTGDIWRFVVFYIPLWLSMLTVFILYILIIREVRRIYGESGKGSEEAKIVRMLVFYPLIFLICWTFPTINRIYQTATDGNELYWLFILHAMSAPSQGFLTSMAYGFTPEMRYRFRQSISSVFPCCGCCAPPEPPVDDSSQSSLNLSLTDDA